MSDTSEIAAYFQDLKRQTEQGFYAPVTGTTLENNKDVLVLTLDYPDTGGTGEYRLSVPEYWESGRELVDFLSNIELGPDSFGEITSRALPVKRVSGSWQVDSTRLQNRDYTVTSIIRTFDITDTTKNSNVSFDVTYDVSSNSDANYVRIEYNNLQNNWADNTFEPNAISGTHSEYQQGGSTGEYEITLTALDSNDTELESQTKTITATNE